MPTLLLPRWGRTATLGLLALGLLALPAHAATVRPPQRAGATPHINGPLVVLDARGGMGQPGPGEVRIRVTSAGLTQQYLTALMAIPPRGSARRPQKSEARPSGIDATAAAAMWAAMMKPTLVTVAPCATA